VADFDWPAKRMLDLEKLIDLCTSIDSWLRADVNNVVVVHCSVSKPCLCIVVVYVRIAKEIGWWGGVIMIFYWFHNSDVHDILIYRYKIHYCDSDIKIFIS